MKRRPLSNAKSQRLFTHTAKSTHPKNVRNAPMRGGYRL